MKIIIPVTLILISFMSVSDTAESDFDMICNVFKNNINSPELKSLTTQEKVYKINEIIWQNIKTKEAIEILSSVAQASPDLKYELFKEAVEMVTGKKWDCPVIRDLKY